MHADNYLKCTMWDKDQRAFKSSPPWTLDPRRDQPFWCRVTYERCKGSCGEKAEIDPFDYPWSTGESKMYN